MSERSHAIAARRVFDGTGMRDDAAVVLEGERIAALVPRSEVPATIPLRDLPESILLAPGFIDIQVNGGGDVLFNDAPGAATVRTILAAHRKLGTTSLLPTLISDTPGKTTAALAAVEALAGAEPGLLGIHLEGPFISPEKAGVHDPGAIRRPTARDIATIMAPRRGVTVVTLAPEYVSASFIAELTRAGIRISLGHTIATYEQTRAAIAAGATGFTHLFNAMRPLDSREPGPIGAALESPHVWYGLIVDGIHVAPAMLRLALRGAGRPVLVSDAMPPVGGVRSSFLLNGETISAHGGRCARADGRLAGACLSLGQAVANCVRLVGAPLEHALRFASTHPAEFLGLGHVLGRLAPGYRADLVALDATSLQTVETWVAGVAGATGSAAARG